MGKYSTYRNWVHVLSVTIVQSTYGIFVDNLFQYQVKLQVHCVQIHGVAKLDVSVPITSRSTYLVVLKIITIGFKTCSSKFLPYKNCKDLFSSIQGTTSTSVQYVARCEGTEVPICEGCEVRPGARNCLPLLESGDILTRLGYLLSNHGQHPFWTCMYIYMQTKPQHYVKQRLS